MRAVKRNVLLNPGPATTTDSVKYAQIVPDICPREREFGDVMRDVCRELTNLAADPEHYTTILFGGSGTAAVEAIISSVISNAALVIVNNGAYGARMREITETYDLPFIEFKSPPYEPIDLNALERLIRSRRAEISHLAVVHLETTTGLLNDIDAIGKLCGKYNIEMIVDAMSSFAAVPITMKAMNISYLAASSNKCLQGMPGVSFCIADKIKLECPPSHRPRSYYLNLFAQYEYFAAHGQMRFTPPVQTIYALKQAIAELNREGIDKRYDRYRRSWEALIDGIARLGLKYLVPEKHHSKIVTTIVEPDCDGFDFESMHDYLYIRGFTVYPGKLGGIRTFRIANIGDITEDDIHLFVKLLKEYLSGIKCLEKGG